MGAQIAIQAGPSRHTVALADYLDAGAREYAASAANDWIKSLRHVAIDGQPMRRRFSFRGDSLWWFTELYLHKRQAALDVFQTSYALGALVDRERPSRIDVESGSAIVRLMTPQIATARGIQCASRQPSSREWWTRLARLDARARALTYAAWASRLRKRRTPPLTQVDVAAFIHTAFWREGSDEGSAESYIGPVLDALESSRPSRGMAYVGIGPSENFRARRWWKTVLQSGRAAVTPIEAFAPLGALKESRRLWAARYDMLRTLTRSAEMRERATIARCDVWPVIREELVGVALLQWPWSARAMDEAAAALDLLRPRVTVTYAEAGGWGRAIVMESRRRGIRTVGLQHGFIYRHWLNYRHETDEMEPDATNRTDAGFPRPDQTLVFDGYAADHLIRAGSFPQEAIDVAGSPRLDALVEAFRRMTPTDVWGARKSTGARGDQTIAILTTKEREARGVLPALFHAVATMPEVALAIKPHPAETPAAYERYGKLPPNVRLLPADVPLAPLLAASHAVVTVNSTVAIDAAVLGLPALVIGLPNNLSPFVDAGVMAGATSAAEIVERLRKILYDQGFRQQLATVRTEFLSRFHIESSGRAAARSAERILGTAGGPARTALSAPEQGVS